MVLQFWQHVQLSSVQLQGQKKKPKPKQTEWLCQCYKVIKVAKHGGRAYLLLHFLNLFYRAASLVFVLHADAEDLVSSAYLLLFLLLGLFQLALGTDALRVVHVVGLHHLEMKGFESLDTLIHYKSTELNSQWAKSLSQKPQLLSRSFYLMQSQLTEAAEVDICT